MTDKKSEHYLSSGEFFTAIIESKISGEISTKLGQMMILLSERNANHRNFVRYHHLRDDIIAIGQLACLKGFENFRPFKDLERSQEWALDMQPIDYNYEYCSNSFAFFTTCIRNAIIQFLKQEYNFSNIKNKKRVELGLDASFGYIDMIKDQEDAAKAEQDKINAADPDYVDPYEDLYEGGLFNDDRD